MKRVLSYILFISLTIMLVIPVSAEESNNATSEMTYTANIAEVNNVNDKGTNISESTNTNVSKYTTEVIVEELEFNYIKMHVMPDNTKLTVTAEPIGRTENGKTIFYSGSISSDRYEIIDFEYNLDSETTNVYFKDILNDNKISKTTVLKLYLRDVLSKTRDYILIEIFGVELDLPMSKRTDLPVNHLLGAWAAREFDPISTELDAYEDTPISPTSHPSADKKTWNCSQVFFSMGEYQTHTISWRTSVDAEKLRTGSDSEILNRITVYSKTMSFTESSDMNSSNESYLHIDSVALRQSSIPNTAWISTDIDGIVQDNSYHGGLSASIGFSLGAIGIDYSVPVSDMFSHGGTIDINQTYDTYENGVNGRYTRAIETKLNSNYKLTQIGHFFNVTSVLRDYGNTAQSNRTLRAIWDVDVINLGKPDRPICSHTCNHSTALSIDV